jgi:hypothetical protein
MMPEQRQISDDFEKTLALVMARRLGIILTSHFKQLVCTLYVWLMTGDNASSVCCVWLYACVLRLLQAAWHLHIRQRQAVARSTASPRTAR